MSLDLKIKKMKIKLIILLIFLSSCGSLGEAGKALRNEKRTSTDEFLIEKRGPLSIPPNINELPKPRTKTILDKEDSNVLGADIKKEKSTGTSSIENVFLEEIRKN
jgi:hypothetical protein